MLVFYLLRQTENDSKIETILYGNRHNKNIKVTHTLSEMEDLPYEILYRIFYELDYNDVKTLCSVCLVFQNVCDDNFFWKNKAMIDLGTSFSEFENSKMKSEERYLELLNTAHIGLLYYDALTRKDLRLINFFRSLLTPNNYRIRDSDIPSSKRPFIDPIGRLNKGQVLDVSNMRLDGTNIKAIPTPSPNSNKIEIQPLWVVSSNPAAYFLYISRAWKLLEFSDLFNKRTFGDSFLL